MDWDVRMPVREGEGDAWKRKRGNMGEAGQEKRQQESRRKESGNMGTSGEGGKDMGKSVRSTERDDGGRKARSQRGVQHGEAETGKDTRTEESGGGGGKSGEEAGRRGM